MSDPKTLAECLDAAKDGTEFAAVINQLFRLLETKPTETEAED